MTIRDYRLTAAARTWARAQLQAETPRQRRSRTKHTSQLLRRARHVPLAAGERMEGR